MGGHTYFYFVPYKDEIETVMQTLRRREFEAGRYNPVVPFRDFPVDENSPKPGAQHASIEKALEASDADGTRSILDMERVGTKPGFGVAVPFPPKRLQELYGTEKPTRSNIEGNMDFFEEIERGGGIYIIVYENAQPTEILFAGMSYD